MKKIGMPQKTLLGLCLLLCLLFSACGSEKPDSALSEGSPEVIGDTAPGEEDTDAASSEEFHEEDALPFDRAEITQVRILLRRSFSGDICVITNETERAAILDTLFSADTGAFADAELSGVAGATLDFVLCTEDAEYDLRIVSDSDAQYLVFSGDDGSQTGKKGPADAFDFPALDGLVSQVLGNEDDPQYAGTVTLAQPEYESAVNKGNCAYARAILDGAIAQSGAADADGELSPEIRFVSGGAAYEIDGETGQFLRTGSDRTEYARLDSRQLTEVRTWLGILAVTP